MFRIISLFLLAGAIVCNEVILVDRLRMEFLNMEEELWKYVLWETPNIDLGDSELYLVNKFSEYDERIKQMPEDILLGLNPIKHIHSFILLYPELRQTENLYEKFRQYLQDQKNATLGDKRLIENMVDSDEIIRDISNKKMGANVTVHNVYDLTFGSENMILKIFEFLEDDYYCKDMFQSQRQVYYNLYNAVALNGLKSYVMLQFVNLMRQVEQGGKGNYTDEAIIIRNNFERRVNETMTVFRGAMELATDKLWRCDPKYHSLGETYDEFTRLLQGHVQNEVDMNPRGTCTKNCAAYYTSKNYGCYDEDSDYCTNMEKCNGKIFGCQFIESHMEICTSKTRSRRYNFIKFESGKYYGKQSSCWKKPVDSWYRWFFHCSYCMCLCDDPNINSDRFINLRPVLSDTKKNRVVTGVRFVKIDRIMHIQIQEGQLLPYGYINQSTVHWVPVNSYKVTDTGVFEGRDFYMMSYEKRSMALDDVKIDKLNYVVTGVKFQVVDNKLRLQIHINPVDWNAGLVLKSADNYVYKATGGVNKVSVSSNADIPTLAKNTEVDIGNNAYVEFTHTGFEADAAQTTIPFIDIQPVYNDPAVPLKGVGVQYRGTKGYGGFIAPTIHSYDFSKLLLVRFPKYDFRTNSPYEIEVN